MSIAVLCFAGLWPDFKRTMQRELAHLQKCTQTRTHIHMHTLTCAYKHINAHAHWHLHARLYAHTHNNAVWVLWRPWHVLRGFLQWVPQLTAAEKGHSYRRGWPSEGVCTCLCVCVHAPVCFCVHACARENAGCTGVVRCWFAVLLFCIAQFSNSKAIEISRKAFDT
jgi:hypothetical protein